MAMFSLFVILSLLPHLLATDTDPYPNYCQLNLPPGGPTAPKTVLFDSLREGPYACVSDGRVLKYGGPDVGFQDFSYTSLNRTEQCDGVTQKNANPTCGRPFGLSFKNILTLSLFNIPIVHIEDLYIVDAFNGLFKVGSDGGEAELIANTAGGLPFHFLDGIDVDPTTGDVYFTDGSQIYDLRNLIQGNFVPDATGRLLRYRPSTGEVEVLLDGLIGPTGPAVSHDGTFLLFTDANNKTIEKYDITVPKSTTHKTLLTFQETPSSIRRATNFGEFWLAANANFASEQSVVTPFGFKFNSTGSILIKKEFVAQYGSLDVTVLQEYDNEVLLVGSTEANFVGVYCKNSTSGNILACRKN